MPELFIVSEQELENYSKNLGIDKRNICVVDGHEIRTMAFRGTNVCGELHRKVRAGIPLGATSMKSY